MRKELKTAWQGAKLPLKVAAVVLLLNLLCFTPKRLYEEHKTQVAKATTHEAALKDRVHNIHPEDPAYWNLEKTIKAFSALRRTSVDKGCGVLLTMPRKGSHSVANIVFFGADLAGCPPTSLDLSTDPEKESAAMKGVEANAVIIHAPKDLKGVLAFSDAMGSLFNVRRSYEPFPGMPPDLIWFQFGADVQWNSQR